MKDVLIRSVFGLLFLMVVFVPFIYDVRNGANLMNVVFFTFTLLGTHELFEMGKKSETPSSLKLPAILLATALFLPLLLQTYSDFFPGIYNPFWMVLISGPTLMILWALLIGFIILMSWWTFKKEHVAHLFKKQLLFALFYPILPLWILAFAYTLTPWTDKPILLIVLLPIYLNDTLAYVFGRLFGKTPLLPQVSPKKTWEGFIGGVSGAALTMVALLYFKGIFTIENILGITFVSFLASILATLGDLFESKIKRSVGVKDSGNVLPGHGGILDRIDAMLFVAPVLYVLLIII